MLKIHGFVKNSFADWDGKIVATIFCFGCNYRCGFCFNPELVCAEHCSALKAKNISEKTILHFLQSRKSFLDGICITGGEPLLQNNLSEFLKKIKKFNFLIKLDHNGSMPNKLEDLINNKLIDYIAMDIKAPFNRYQKITNSKIQTLTIKKSIDLIINSGIDHEFRSTILPNLHKKQDILQMAKMIKNGKRYFLQSFKNAKTLDPKFKKYKSYTKEQMQKLAKACNKYIKTEYR
ncbi:anaerobic ribonucleoside-triphosphate reductase activating protein [bacterium]|nr:anaerobic ribonucleoside-triphosphate reductase activating protein [bacterium]|tara:strand:+ start:6177 stop:6878 length:702 start_codon:yes stop_codon:yes gene_type:complete